MTRYSRNIKVIGEEGQARLASSSIMIIGCGALGGQIAMLMAGSGIGRIGIADFDHIEISNLQRQLFFTEADEGKSKAELLGKRMKALNSEVEISIYDVKIDARNAASILSGYDLIIEATDNASTKYFIDSETQSLRLPCIIGGVNGWRGQVAALANNNPDIPGFRDIFPLSENEIQKLSSEKPGVIGATPSSIASIQASEAIQMLLTDRKDRKSRMIFIDLENLVFQTVAL